MFSRASCNMCSVVLKKVRLVSLFKCCAFEIVHNCRSYVLWKVLSQRLSIFRMKKTNFITFDVWILYIQINSLIFIFIIYSDISAKCIKYLVIWTSLLNSIFWTFVRTGSVEEYPSDPDYGFYPNEPYYPNELGYLDEPGYLDDANNYSSMPMYANETYYPNDGSNYPTESSYQEVAQSNWYPSDVQGVDNNYATIGGGYSVQPPDKLSTILEGAIRVYEIFFKLLWLTVFTRLIFENSFRISSVNFVFVQDYWLVAWFCCWVKLRSIGWGSYSGEQSALVSSWVDKFSSLEDQISAYPSLVQMEICDSKVVGSNPRASKVWERLTAAEMPTIKEESYLINERWRGINLKVNSFVLYFLFWTGRKSFVIVNLSVWCLNTCSINHMILFLCSPR